MQGIETKCVHVLAFAMRWIVPFLPLAATQGMEGRRSEHPRVLVDRSHEWLFAYDDLSERMLRPAGFEVVLCDSSLNTKAKLADFDIVMVQQAACPFDFSSEEIALLKNYVNSGGCLLVVGNPRYPIAKLAAAFGFRLEKHECQTPLLPSKSLKDSFGAQDVLQTRPIACRIRFPQSAEVLITDQRGVPVAARASFGRGAVICFADNTAYWDFCAQRDRQMKVPNVPTTVALFRCLLPNLKPIGNGPPVVRLTAELETTLPGIVVRYSRPVAAKGTALLDAIPRIAASVANRNKTKRPADTLVVNVLAGGGGGYSGGREIGVQCAGTMAANVAVIAHEMTHSWTGPLPGIVGEGWASMVGMRVTRELGYREAAGAERKAWREQQSKAEAGGKHLDFAVLERDPSLSGPCEAKMMWMIEQLEKDYGDDFMPRFLRITRALKGNQRPTVSEVLYYFTLAAGKDLSAFYKQAGISYLLPAPVSKEELQHRLADYEQ